MDRPSVLRAKVQEAGGVPAPLVDRYAAVASGLSIDDRVRNKLGQQWRTAGLQRSLAERRVSRPLLRGSWHRPGLRA